MEDSSCLFEFMATDVLERWKNLQLKDTHNANARVTSVCTETLRDASDAHGHQPQQVAQFVGRRRQDDLHEHVKRHTSHVTSPEINIERQHLSHCHAATHLCAVGGSALVVVGAFQPSELACFNWVKKAEGGGGGGGQRLCCDGCVSALCER